MYWSLENVPWTNLHDLNLDWIVNTMKQTVEQWIAYRLEMDGKYADFTEQVNSDFDEFTAGINEWKTLIETKFSDLQTYVQDYFDNLDLNESTRYVINQMIASGEFVTVLNPSIVTAVENWLAENITPTSPAVDATLTVSGAAADAKVTGDRFTEVQSISYNLFNADTFSHGWYDTNGNLTQAGNQVYAISELISVTPNTYYCLQCDSNYAHGMQFAWFDSNNMFIKRDNIVDTENTFNAFNAIAPANAAYVHVGIYTYPTNINSTRLKNNHVMLSQSAFQQTYSPYYTAQDRIARNETESLSDFPSLNGNNINAWIVSDWIAGMLRTADGILDPYSTTRLASGYFYLTDVTQLQIATDVNYEHRCLFYDKTGAFINTTEQTTWRGVGRTWTIPTNAFAFRVCIRKKNDATITPNENTKCIIYRHTNYKLKNNSFLTGKKLSILGDSLSTYAGINRWNTATTPAYADGEYCYEGNLCRYPQFDLLQNVQDIYWMKLINEYNMTLGINESYAGSKVAGEDNTAISSLFRINHLDDNGTPDIILINAGTNDISGNVPIGEFNTENPTSYTEEEIENLPVTTFADAYRTMIIRLQYYYQNSRLIVILPNYTTSYATPERVDAYNEMIKTICDYFGVFYIDTRTTGITFYNRLTYVPDTVHYNALGMELLYQKIKNGLIAQFG